MKTPTAGSQFDRSLTRSTTGSTQVGYLALAGAIALTGVASFTAWGEASYLALAGNTQPEPIVSHTGNAARAEEPGGTSPVEASDSPSVGAVGIAAERELIPGVSNTEVLEATQVAIANEDRELLDAILAEVTNEDLFVLLQATDANMSDLALKNFRYRSMHGLTDEEKATALLQRARYLGGAAATLSFVGMGDAEFNRIYELASSMQADMDVDTLRGQQIRGDYTHGFWGAFKGFFKESFRRVTEEKRSGFFGVLDAAWDSVLSVGSIATNFVRHMWDWTGLDSRRGWLGGKETAALERIYIRELPEFQGTPREAANATIALWLLEKGVISEEQMPGEELSSEEFFDSVRQLVANDPETMMLMASLEFQIALGRQMAAMEMIELRNGDHIRSKKDADAAVERARSEAARLLEADPDHPMADLLREFTNPNTEYVGAEFMAALAETSLTTFMDTPGIRGMLRAMPRFSEATQALTGVPLSMYALVGILDPPTVEDATAAEAQAHAEAEAAEAEPVEAGLGTVGTIR